jgi:hypothetical protein
LQHFLAGQPALIEWVMSASTRPPVNRGTSRVQKGFSNCSYWLTAAMPPTTLNWIGPSAAWPAEKHAE